MNLEPNELAAIRRSRLFAATPFETVWQHLEHASAIDLAPQAVLIEPGQENRAVFLVLSGEISTLLIGEGRDEVARIGPGECVGEQSLIDDRRASSLAIAIAPTRVLSIAPSRFWELMRAESTIALNLLQVISERIRRNNAAMLRAMTRQLQLQLSPTIDLETGLHNRRWMDEMFARAIGRAERSSGALALVMFSPDRAPSPADDQPARVRALQHLAGIASRHLRPGDLCARHSDDTLCALLDGADAGRALRAAERLREAIQAAPLLTSGGGSIAVTASVGAAAWQPGVTLSALAESAHAALLRARSHGGDAAVLEPTSGFEPCQAKAA